MGETGAFPATSTLQGCSQPTCLLPQSVVWHHRPFEALSLEDTSRALYRALTVLFVATGLHQPRVTDQSLYFAVLDEASSEARWICPRVMRSASANHGCGRGAAITRAIGM